VPICTELNTPAGPIDNFMVTPSGLPVLVACKLWRNPEARREVVGQILDYDRELSRWSSSDLQREASRRVKCSGNPLLERVRAVNPAVDETQVNDSLTANLRRGRFLLLIVGDPSGAWRTGLTMANRVLVETFLPVEEAGRASFHQGLNGCTPRGMDWAAQGRFHAVAADLAPAAWSDDRFLPVNPPAWIASAAAFAINALLRWGGPSGTTAAGSQGRYLCASVFICVSPYSVGPTTTLHPGLSAGGRSVPR
jgi:hypothetical protein